MEHHKQRIIDTYNSIASIYGEDRGSFFDHYGERLVAYAAPAAGGKVLDVATGKGAVLRPAAIAVGPTGSVVGIDISKNMLYESKKKISFPWVQWLHMDAEEQLSFSDNTFDVVFCGFSLFFFQDLSRTLSEFIRVLVPGGVLAFSTWGAKPFLWTCVAESAAQLGATKTLEVNSLNHTTIIQKHLNLEGLHSPEIHKETKTIGFENAEKWWDSLCSRGIKYRLEQLSVANLDVLKQASLAKANAIHPAGKISIEEQVLYTTVRKTDSRSNQY